jgi:hypothetical protein
MPRKIRYLPAPKQVIPPVLYYEDIRGAINILNISDITNLKKGEPELIRQVALSLSEKRNGKKPKQFLISKDVEV